MTTIRDHDEDDLLAAEYVLGTLDHDERNAARARVSADPEFAAAVARWEDRFSVWNDSYAEAPPPDMLPQIEARLFGVPDTPARRRRFRWQGGWLGGLAGGAVAALVAALVLMIVAPRPDAPDLPVPALQADLRAEESDLVIAARWFPDQGILDLARQSGADAGTGQDYELWLIAPDADPVSMGVFRGTTAALTPPVTPSGGWLVALSLEPEGGSPTGQPTGPVLAAAPLQAD